MIFLTKCGGRLSNLLKIKCTKFCLDSFRFNISVIQCLGGFAFLLDTVYNKMSF